MKFFLRTAFAVALCTSCLIHPANAQEVPQRPDRPWLTPEESKLASRVIAGRQPREAALEDKSYTFAELIDYAEGHNPETREAWENAIAQLKAKNIARSELFPNLELGMLASSQRKGVLLYDVFVRQELGTAEASVRMSSLRQDD